MDYHLRHANATPAPNVLPKRTVVSARTPRRDPTTPAHYTFPSQPHLPTTTGMPVTAYLLVPSTSTAPVPVRAERSVRPSCVTDTLPHAYLRRISTYVHKTYILVRTNMHHSRSAAYTAAVILYLFRTCRYTAFVHLAASRCAAGICVHGYYCCACLNTRIVKTLVRAMPVAVVTIYAQSMNRINSIERNRRRYRARLPVARCCGVAVTALPLRTEQPIPMHRTPRYA